MSLSNMRNEPRREITETLVGAGVVLPILGLYGYCDHLFASWFYDYSGPVGTANHVPYVAGLIIGWLASVICFFAGWLLLHLLHHWGERVCDALDNRGIYLRPVRPTIKIVRDGFAYSWQTVSTPATPIKIVTGYHNAP